jgi:hypothetical protein
VPLFRLLEDAYDSLFRELAASFCIERASVHMNSSCRFDGRSAAKLITTTRVTRVRVSQVEQNINVHAYSVSDALCRRARSLHRTLSSHFVCTHRGIRGELAASPPIAFMGVSILLELRLSVETNI